MGKELTRIKETLSEHSRKIDFFVRTSLPPVEGIFFDGQIFDAYKFATDLIKSAKKSLLLIDNYVDESVLLMLSKRNPGVSATIYTQKITKQLQLDLDKHNDQYPPVNIRTYRNSHDRFLIIDDKEVYHIGASLKDLGKKMFAFSKLEIEEQSDVEECPERIEQTIQTTMLGMPLRSMVTYGALREEQLNRFLTEINQESC